MKPLFESTSWTPRSTLTFAEVYHGCVHPFSMIQQASPEIDA
jgi:hypothetical protein